jgi:cytochrome b subunit of formate dehydrogenase
MRFFFLSVSILILIFVRVILLQFPLNLFEREIDRIKLDYFIVKNIILLLGIMILIYIYFRLKGSINVGV